MSMSAKQDSQFLRDAFDTAYSLPDRFRNLPRSLKITALAVATALITFVLFATVGFRVLDTIEDMARPPLMTHLALPYELGERPTLTLDTTPFEERPAFIVLDDEYDDMREQIARERVYEAEADGSLWGMLTQAENDARAQAVADWLAQAEAERQAELEAQALAAEQAALDGEEAIIEEEAFITETDPFAPVPLLDRAANMSVDEIAWELNIVIDEIDPLTLFLPTVTDAEIIERLLPDYRPDHYVVLPPMVGFTREITRQTPALHRSSICVLTQDVTEIRDENDETFILETIIEPACGLSFEPVFTETAHYRQIESDEIVRVTAVRFASERQTYRAMFDVMRDAQQSGRVGNFAIPDSLPDRYFSSHTADGTLFVWSRGEWMFLVSADRFATVEAMIALLPF